MEPFLNVLPQKGPITSNSSINATASDRASAFQRFTRTQPYSIGSTQHMDGRGISSSSRTPAYATDFKQQGLYGMEKETDGIRRQPYVYHQSVLSQPFNYSQRNRNSSGLPGNNTTAAAGGFANRTYSRFAEPDGSTSTRTKISQYFTGTKSVQDRPNVKPVQKRSLRDLQEKYDTVFSVPADITEEELRDRVSEVSQMVGKSTVQKSFYGEPIPKTKKVMSTTTSLSREIEKRQIVSEKKAKPKMIHIVGQVENVMRWSCILKDVEIYVLYNVLATFMSRMDGTHRKEKLVFVKGNNGTILECSFYETDRPLPKISKGEFVSCFGQIIGAQRFRLIHIYVLTEETYTQSQRAIFVSQRVVHELRDSKST